ENFFKRGLTQAGIPLIVGIARNLWGQIWQYCPGHAHLGCYRSMIVTKNRDLLCDPCGPLIDGSVSYIGRTTRLVILSQLIKEYSRRQPAKKDPFSIISCSFEGYGFW